MQSITKPKKFQNTFQVNMQKALLFIALLKKNIVILFHIRIFKTLFCCILQLSKGYLFYIVIDNKISEKKK